jgi:hypothetical protein
MLLGLQNICRRLRILVKGLFASCGRQKSVKKNPPDLPGRKGAANKYM